MKEKMIFTLLLAWFIASAVFTFNQKADSAYTESGAWTANEKAKVISLLEEIRDNTK